MPGRRCHGTPAPSSARDPLDLHEAFVEIRPDQKTGFGAALGRATANYGDTRLIGSPQWAYIPRIYDGGRVYWRNGRYKLEAFLLSPVKLTSAGWNKPVMGDRVEGTYNVVTLNKHATTDLYYLRHYQNRPGGFNGVGRLVTNSYGSRWFGPIAHGFRYTGGRRSSDRGNRACSAPGIRMGCSSRSRGNLASEAAGCFGRVQVRIRR